MAYKSEKWGWVNKRLDEFLRTQDPGYTPTWQTEALGQTVNNQNVIFVNVDYVLLEESFSNDNKQQRWSAVYRLTAALMVLPSQLLV